MEKHEREKRLVTASERAYIILSSRQEMPEFYRSGALRDLRDALNEYKED